MEKHKLKWSTRRLSDSRSVMYGHTEVRLSYEGISVVHIISDFDGWTFKHSCLPLRYKKGTFSKYLESKFKGMIQSVHNRLQAIERGELL